MTQLTLHRRYELELGNVVRKSTLAKRAKAKRAKTRVGIVIKPRPGQVETTPPGTAPKRGQVKILKGQISARARAGLFAKQARLKSIIGRKVAPKARFATPKEFAGFAEGVVIDRIAVNSDWVSHVLLVMHNDAPRLGFRFRKDGVEIVYTTSNLTDFKHAAGAASKGKFIWRALYHGVPGAGAPYNVIKGRVLGQTKKAARKAKRPRFPAPF